MNRLSPIQLILIAMVFITSIQLRQVSQQNHELERIKSNLSHLTTGHDLIAAKINEWTPIIETENDHTTITMDKHYYQEVCHLITLIPKRFITMTITDDILRVRLNWSP